MKAAVTLRLQLDTETVSEYWERIADLPFPPFIGLEVNNWRVISVGIGLSGETPLVTLEPLFDRSHDHERRELAAKGFNRLS